jgi:lysophospholipase L1-like esterase
VTARSVAGLLLSLLGLAYLVSGLILNPIVAHALLGSRSVDYADVLFAYVAWSTAIGGVVFVLGRVVGSGRVRAFDGPSLLLVILLSIVLLDRLLLAGLGLPLWAYDRELGYRNRPNKVVSLRPYGRPDDLVRINSHGQHDDEIPVEKPSREYRILMLGDSVTMGDGVPLPETFSSQLEALLKAESTDYDAVQVINTGVHGYSTSQELGVLKRSLEFAPDLVVLGFCMNDVTEPFVTNLDLGGVGLDYHGVQQTPNPLMGYLLNETGTGRLLQKMRAKDASRATAKRSELYDVRAMARAGRAEPRFNEAWELILRDLDAIHGIAKSKELPLLLVVFPFTFQLSDPEARQPQEILQTYAATRGIDLIDFTEVFERLVFEDTSLRADIVARGYGPEQVESFFDWRTREYFFDDDHLTAAGHRVVAQVLRDYLMSKRLLGGAPKSVSE